MRIPSAGWSSFPCPLIPEAARGPARAGTDGRARQAGLASLASLAEASRKALFDLLAAARDRHFLGPGEVGAHLAHSAAFAALIDRTPDGLSPAPDGLSPAPEGLSPAPDGLSPARAVDLGSGAGIPGLVLALLWPGSTWALVDANVRRTDFLRHAVATLDLDGRVEVLTRRAEDVGRDPAWRAGADLVVARGFGPPAVAAECAAPLLHIDGVLVVAEPPGGKPDRWPAAGLEPLGLAADGGITEPVALQRLRQVAACPPRYPRRVGVPLKRPLF